MRPVARALLLCAFLTPGFTRLAAQDQAKDRRRFIDPSAPVSDDPRRVPVPPGPRGPAGSIVLQGGRIFDGTGAPAREATIVIENNRISRIVAPGTSGWPADARILNVAGKTVMPGLIDLHVHLTVSGDPGPNVGQDTAGIPPAPGDADATLRGVEKLRYFIESGITSVRDVASHGDAPFRLKLWVAGRRLAGPRVFPVGKLITGTGGHGAEGLGPAN